jgi:hypothetical protein
MLACENGPQPGGFKELRERVVKLTTTLMQQHNRSFLLKNIDSNAKIVNRRDGKLIFQPQI